MLKRGEPHRSTHAANVTPHKDAGEHVAPTWVAAAGARYCVRGMRVRPHTLPVRQACEHRPIIMSDVDDGRTRSQYVWAVIVSCLHIPNFVWPIIVRYVRCAVARMQIKQCTAAVEHIVNR